MAFSPSDLIDRRRLRRKLGFWRILAIAAVAAALAALAFAAGLRPGASASPRDVIAKVEISGLITEDREMLQLLERLGDDSSVRAVILKINSPGGTTVGGETLYRAARDLAERKPVGAEVGTLAASAAYMVASASDHIVAHNTSIVGSIGVIFQYVDASVLLDRVGVDVNAIRSGPLKAEPSPFAPAPEAARQMIERMVLSTFDWFVALVAERRGMSEAEVRVLADGSVFSGEQGLANRLVDALGGEREVRRWLEEERGVPAGLEIVDREPERDRGPFSFLRLAQSSLFSVLGLDPEARTLPEALRRSAGHLDGLLSLWQPVSSGS